MEKKGLHEAVGRKFEYFGDDYELVQVEPTIVLENLNDGSYVEMTFETFRKQALDGTIRIIGENS